MSVTGIRNRVGLLEAAAGTNAPKFRVVLVGAGDDADAVIAAADLKEDETALVVRFRAAGAAA